MSILSESTIQDIKRLLELFPLANLRAEWPAVKGTKDELCFSVAESKDTERISRFVDENLTCCRQHVYVFDQNLTLPFPDLIPEGAKVLQVGLASALYLIRVRYILVLKNPFEDSFLDFLWPVRIEYRLNYVTVRFVVLERTLSAYLDRPFYVDDRSVEEETVVQSVASQLQLARADLHKGVKKLWKDGFMDSVRADYKKPNSKASETMDEEKGIRETDPDLYGILQGSPILNSIFAIDAKQKCTVSAFSAKPAQGYLAFLRYSELKGDTDYVIQQILDNNQ